MGNLMRGFLVAVVAGLLVWAPAALACGCEAQGRLVCTGTDVGVQNVSVEFWNVDPGLIAATTDASGNFVAWLDWCDRTYSVTLDLTAAGDGRVSEPPVTCPVGGTSMYLKYEVDVPECAPPPPPTADCSPGYYKNHPETWCAQCDFGPVGSAGCNAAVCNLTPQCAGTASVREDQKKAIDACFGTAAASPCKDDDS